MIKFKLSKYIVVSEKKDDHLLSKRILFSLRSGVTRIITNGVYDLLINGHFEIIPDNLFRNLVKYDIVVPEEEDELQTTLNRLKCSNSVSLIINQEEITDKGIDLEGPIEQCLSEKPYTKVNLIWFFNNSQTSHNLKNIRAELNSIQEKIKDNASLTNIVIINSRLIKQNQFNNLFSAYDSAHIIIDYDKNNTVRDLPNLQELISELKNKFPSHNYSLNFNPEAHLENHAEHPDYIDSLSEKELAGYFSITTNPLLSGIRKDKKEDLAASEFKILVKLRELKLNWSLIPNHTPKVSFSSTCIREITDQFSDVFDLKEINSEHQKSNYQLNTRCKECLFLPSCGGKWNNNEVMDDSSCPTYKYNLRDRLSFELNLVVAKS